jgi:hypothetical protein
LAFLGEVCGHLADHAAKFESVTRAAEGEHDVGSMRMLVDEEVAVGGVFVEAGLEGRAFADLRSKKLAEEGPQIPAIQTGKRSRALRAAALPRLRERLLTEAMNQESKKAGRRGERA